ncbi:hypothetical protein [Nostoc sp. 106C]|uniref:hypothetical protein n=2 Tax=Nostoc sp. 106C TaxID=1932667 RepID=UPI00117CF804|nr:hypothetical protein [Nostoc sp. 106C]
MTRRAYLQSWMTVLLASIFVINNFPSRAAQTQPETKGASLPTSLRDKILQDMAWRSFVPKPEVQILRTEEALFNGCLDVAPLDQLCSAIGLRGWKVTIAARQNRWIYHATQNYGFKLNARASLSPAIANEVLEEASWRSGLPFSQLKIYWVENKTWDNSCFGLPGLISCIAAKTPGWQVTVTDGTKQRWVYRTGLSYSALFDIAASQINPKIPPNFTKGTANAVLQDMSKRTAIPLAALQVVSAEPRILNGCLDIAPPGTACTEIGLPGWRVVAQGYQQRWVYHVATGRGLKLNGPESLPRKLVRGVLKDVYPATETPPANLKIFWVEQKVWTDSCRGFPVSVPKDICTPGNFPGWIVTTTNGEQNWVYHTGLYEGATLFSTSKKQ